MRIQTDPVVWGGDDRGLKEEERGRGESGFE
jgi:hypothetical protein